MPSLRVVAPDQCANVVSLRPVLAALAPLLPEMGPLSDLTRTGMQALLRDLSFATAALASGARDRVVVPTEATSSPLLGALGSSKGAVWEVGLERDRDRALVTVFHQGSNAHVAQSERPVPLLAARDALLAGIDRFADLCGVATVAAGGAVPLDRGLALAREQLLAVTADRDAGAPPSSTRTLVSVRGPRRSRLTLSATLELRKPQRTASADELARADLHALLFRGELTATVGRSQRRLSGVHVFLLCEVLVQLALDALTARADGRAVLRQLTAGSVRCGVQLDHAGMTVLVLGGRELAGTDRAAWPDMAAEIHGWRLPAIPCEDLARAVAGFARALGRQILALDRSQATNLRLRQLGVAAEGLRERGRLDRARVSLINDAPESYRAFAESDTRPPPAVAGGRPPAGKLRFSESWRADVPGIDLRSLFLHGDQLLVGSAREIACLERTTGQLVWTRRAARAVSILTPAGLVRLAPDGRMALHDLGDGELVFELRLAPCAGARASGAVIAAPGLPRLLLVGEGLRHLAAIDLDSSELRWRRALRRRGELRLRRAGKLVVVAAGEPELVALDLLSGEVVWRMCGPGRFVGAGTVDEGDLFCVATAVPGRRGMLTLHRVDAWSGAERWSVAAPRPTTALGAPLVTSDTVLLASRDDDARGRAVGLMAFERATGRLRFDLPGALCRGHAARVLVDELLIANAESGELVAIDVRDGTTRYRHVFAGAATRPQPADRPLSIQPVLRCGALFLPHAELTVVRPRDGALLGRAPTDLVPDALRVDERCGVYVAEASGYLAAYHALPTLTLVSQA